MGLDRRKRQEDQTIPTAIGPDPEVPTEEEAVVVEEEDDHPGQGKKDK